MYGLFPLGKELSNRVHQQARIRVIFVTVNKEPLGQTVVTKEGSASMSISLLLEKLIEIERSIGVETDMTLRKQVIDAQDCLLSIQKEVVEKLCKDPHPAMRKPFPTSTYAA